MAFVSYRLSGGSSSTEQPLMHFLWQNEHHHFGDAFELISNMLDVANDVSSTDISLQYVKKQMEEKLIQHIRVRAIDDSCNIGHVASWNPDLVKEQKTDHPTEL